MKKLLIIFLFCISFSLFGAGMEGNIYWIQFNTKAGTPFRINQPELFLSQRAIERRKRQGIEIDSTDLPVNPQLIDSLRSIGFAAKHYSRWMNGVIATYHDTVDIDSINLPSFVSFIEIRKSTQLKSVSSEPENKFEVIDSLTQKYYGSSTNQITMLNGQLLHKYSKGKNIHIAVIDAGFLNADTLEVFDSLYARDGVLGTYDFVNPGNNVYNEHFHGTNVLSILAANHPGKMIGVAPEASYWLLLTEYGSEDYPDEEDYWGVAAEFADSVGCDVITTSLGYSNYFADQKYNHRYDEFTGDSLRISKSANLAVKKGIVVVCSAGNDGNKSFHYISTPSEARDVLSVAAVNNLGEIANFSSRGFGPGAKVPKPDVSAMGAGTSIVTPFGKYDTGSGTSYSAPLISGLAACLIDLFPDSTATSIIKMIREAGHLYPKHSDEYGYGIPDFGKYLARIIQNKNDFKEKNSITFFPNPFNDNLYFISQNKIERIEIYSFNGQIVFSAGKDDPVLRNQTLTSLSNLPKGLYLAVISDYKSTQTIKLIKQ